jgi:Kef-type K+ transport system membrane component KefB
VDTVTQIPGLIMQGFDAIRAFQVPILILTGVISVIGLYAGKTMKFVKLPSIIGFMIVGVLLGPSLFNVLNEQVQEQLSFITEIALGFVALTIGLELSMGSLKEQGKSIILIIFSESFMAFLITASAVYLFAKISPIPDSAAMPLALIFGAIAPASAPAGTVAIIKEYNARGLLTRALYSVVGFDDGLGIIIFGFCAAIAKSILSSQTGNALPVGEMISGPLIEIGISVLVGSVIGFFYARLVKRLSSGKDKFILTFAVVFIVTGLCAVLHLSLILTNMIVGIMVVNTLPHAETHKIGEQLSSVMPLLFVLFFVMAGANLHLLALPSLGLLGLVYVLGRSTGLMSGAWLGAVIGRADPKIRKYLGMGILSQAGVAIGLSLIVKHEFSGLGLNDAGSFIGSTVITTVTATSIIFEIVGPILTKIGLKKAGEINVNQHQ